MQWARIKKFSKNYDARCHSERESLLPFIWQGCSTIPKFFSICLVKKIELSKTGSETWHGALWSAGIRQGIVVKLDKTEKAAWFAKTYNTNDRNVMGNFKPGENMRKTFIQSMSQTAQKEKSSSEPPVSLITADWIIYIYNRRKVWVIKRQFSNYY